MGKSVAIICNGDFPAKPYPRYLIQTADFIVCCDGAAEAYFRNMGKIFGESGRQPDVIIGDMDSLKPSTAKKFGGKLVTVADQETNDLTKAVKHVLEEIQDVSQITILGASGKREDHTIGNLSLLMTYAKDFNLEERGIRMEAVSDHSTAFAMTDSGEIHCGTGRSMSIFTADTSLRISLLNTMKQIQKELGVAYFFITHDLALGKYFSKGQDAMVMYLGRCVEKGTKDQIFNNPRHPYTQALLSATPRLNPDDRRERIKLTGELPSPLNPPPGCAFNARCRRRFGPCTQLQPQLKDYGGQLVACFAVDQDENPQR